MLKDAVREVVLETSGFGAGIEDLFEGPCFEDDDEGLSQEGYAEMRSLIEAAQDSIRVMSA
jgi:hypothetical protein